ncbi:MAG: VWA domain-containing protein [Bacteroidota bacterium]|nr:VWA domain-containing protein [Bacteroidota bacterium]
MTEHAASGWMAARLKQAAAQGAAWTVVGMAFLALDRRFEWAVPTAFWWGTAVVGWSLWRIAQPMVAPAFRINLRHLDLIPPRRDQWIPLVPDGLRTVALGLIVLVLARPQSSSSIENMTREGIDIVMAMDASASMLSKDFRPNRLEAAKAVASEFVEDRPFDRVGVVVYEGESFTQVPLTTDHRVVQDGLNALETGRVEGGTAIGMGLATAVNRLRKSDAKSKVVILITDGENNSGQIEPQDAAQLARLESIRVYTVGVGTIGRAKSPVRQRPDGSYIYDWVEVNIDEPTLKSIAQETGGRYFRATSGDKLKEIYTEIDALEKTRFNVFRYNKKTEEFPLVGWFALACLAAEAVFRHLFIRSLP